MTSCETRGEDDGDDIDDYRYRYRRLRDETNERGRERDEQNPDLHSGSSSQISWFATVEHAGYKYHNTVAIQDTKWGVFTSRIVP